MKIKDPCGSRQMDMQACPLGSLPAEIRTERLLLSPLGPQYVKRSFVCLKRRPGKHKIHAGSA